MTVKVKSVKKVEGDASVCVVRGTKRYLFDLNADLDYEVWVSYNSIYYFYACYLGLGLQNVVFFSARRYHFLGVSLVFHLASFLYRYMWMNRLEWTRTTTAASRRGKALTRAP